MGPRGNVQSRRRFLFLKDWNLRIIFIRVLDRCCMLVSICEGIEETNADTQSVKLPSSSSLSSIHLQGVIRERIRHLEYAARLFYHEISVCFVLNGLRSLGPIIGLGLDIH